MFSEEFKAEMMGEFRKAMRDEICTLFSEMKPHVRIIDLPPFLTRAQLKELFHIKDTKASELLSRSDFPVLREAGGVLIPTHMLMQWVEINTDWVQSNTTYLKSIS